MFSGFIARVISSLTLVATLGELCYLEKTTYLTLPSCYRRVSYTQEDRECF